MNTKTVECFGIDFIVEKIRQEINIANEKLASKDATLKVAYFCGDTPISNNIAGVNDGSGSTTFPCRRCYAHKSEIMDLRQHSDCRLRKISDFDNIKISSVPKDSLGYKRVPLLAAIPEFFNPFSQTPMDIMHLLTDGVARYQVLKLILVVKIF